MVCTTMPHGRAGRLAHEAATIKVLFVDLFLDAHSGGPPDDEL
jgi:hypothetical protein